jgi:hypothetical protein
MDFIANYTISIDTRRQVLVFTENPPDPEARGGHDEAWWRETFKGFREAHEGWRDYARSRKGRLTEKAQIFVDSQVRESERLLQRLDGFASDNAVPRHWR